MLDNVKLIIDSFFNDPKAFLSSIPSSSALYTSAVRWILMILSFYILMRAIIALLSTKTPSEIWAYLSLPDGSSKPIRHWENVIGRSKTVDIPIEIPTVSRNHGSLVRSVDGKWYYNDLGSKSGSSVNGQIVYKPVCVRAGDVINMGGAECVLVPASLEEQRYNHEARKKITKKFTPWCSLVALTIIQILVVLQFKITQGESMSNSIPIGFGILCAVMWLYCIIIRSTGTKFFEIETIAFFLSTLGLSVTATASPDSVIKQSITVCLGVILFVVICIYLRDLKRAMKTRTLLVLGSVLLLVINLVFGANQYGATNWVQIGGFTFQPSELVKIAYILVGAATLDELFEKKNLTLFIGFSIFCLGSLAIMGDFGTAAIYFIAFLVISFMRSGDFSKLFLLISAAGVGGLMVLRFKPYILGRIGVWRHAWDFPDAGGFQQVRTMSAGASGGLVGVGPGEGWLKNVFAADKDLVFGVLSEEWGLIVAVLAILSIVTLGIFAVKSIKAGRSAFYTIAACTATTMFIFQTILNVFGSVDLLPLTGVTFPFVSNGGTSMIASWGMLAFLKAADTRQDASIAVRRMKGAR